MDSKFYVSYEAARLLKEKGYDRECMAYYQNDEFHLYAFSRYDLSINDKNAAPSYMNQYSAPTKAEAIDWLESRGIVISVEYINGLWDCQIYSFVDGTILHGKALPMEYDVVNLQTRLEAEEAAIINALKLL